MRREIVRVARREGCLRHAWALALLALAAGGGCDGDLPAAPAPQTVTATPAQSVPAPPADIPQRSAPEAAAPVAEQGERLHEESVECNGATLYGLVPRAWVRDAVPGGECGGRWTVPAPDGSRAWVIVHCLAAGRVGLAELDVWYRLFRQPDGSPLPEVGTGRASLSSTCDLREVGIETRGTLVEPITCAPITPPAADTALRRSALETPRSMFVFDLVGPPATLETELSGVSGSTRWSSSIAADFTSFVSSMRATSSPTVTSAYTRPCP